MSGRCYKRIEILHDAIVYRGARYAKEVYIISLVLVIYICRTDNQTPLSATVEKQNWGVNFCGMGAGSAIVSRGAVFLTSACEAVDQNQFASVKMM